VLRVRKTWAAAKCEEILGKLEYKDANPHRDVAVYMQGLGFKANAPKRRDGVGDSDKVYVRWEHKGSRRVTVYQDINGLLTDSQRLFAFAKAIDGAVPAVGVHPKVKFFYAGSSVDVILAAGKALREHADSPA